ncbi:MAG TPA: DUF72 domain-containing protein, partial [Acidimicrobiales bacterium]|nr:DUF72 domain-containing protein [Acidimicrobiales bacterium]
SRFPPTPDLARQWVERTPDGFTIDVQAWTLLTGAAALPDSLWEDLRDEVLPERRDGRRLYLGHLSAAGRAEAWARFRHALRPLAGAGRLGVVVLRYPAWLPPGGTARALLAEAGAELGDLPAAVELAHPRWLQGGACEETLGLLEDAGLGFVCVDRPPEEGRPVVAATSDVAVVRLPGRSPGRWGEAGLPTAERLAYRYTDEELAGWVPALRELAASAAEVHVILSNTFRDDAVTNAEGLLRLLRSV